MPSGRTHDAITLILAAPAAAAGYAAAGSYRAAALVGTAFIIGGLVFGPDLDTVSRQYSRWSILRFLWFPYRSFFSHRSRFSHGLIFGALIRVIYFFGATTLAALTITFLAAAVTNGQAVPIDTFIDLWRRIGAMSRDLLGNYMPLQVFLGLWLGAASHTFTDMAGSFIKTGRVAKFL